MPDWLVILSAVVTAIIFTWTVIALVGVAVWNHRLRRALRAHRDWHYANDGEQGDIPEDHDL